MLLLVAVCSAAFLGCEATRCCAAAADGDVVALATVADGIALPAVVIVTADDDDDGTAASAAAIPASRRLRMKPVNQTTDSVFHSIENETNVTSGKNSFARGFVPPKTLDVIKS